MNQQEIRDKIVEAICNHLGRRPEVDDAAIDVYAIFQEYAREAAGLGWEAGQDHSGWSAAQNKQQFLNELFPEGK